MSARLDRLFSLFEGRGEIDQVEFRKIADFVDEGGEGKFEFSERGILLRAGSGGDKGTQVSHALFQRGGHNSLRLTEIHRLSCTAFLVRPRDTP